MVSADTQNSQVQALLLRIFSSFAALPPDISGEVPCSVSPCPGSHCACASLRMCRLSAGATLLCIVHDSAFALIEAVEQQCV